MERMFSFQRCWNVSTESTKSFYTRREGTCFPFFTCEAKCDEEALDIADRANANGMAIVLQGIVKLHHCAERVNNYIVGQSQFNYDIATIGIEKFNLLPYYIARPP